MDTTNWRTLAARNLGVAEQIGLPVASLCNGCFETLNTANRVLKANPEKKARVNDLLKEAGYEYRGELEVKHVSIRSSRLWKRLERMGIDTGRLHLSWFSAAEGDQFANKIREMSAFSARRSRLKKSRKPGASSPQRPLSQAGVPFAPGFIYSA